MAGEGPADCMWRSGETARRIVVLAVALLLAGGMVYYYNCVLMPIWDKESQLPNAGPGNRSDLYPRWVGARELLWHHRNPYSAEITREIQRGFYGRELDPANPTGPTDPEAFAYPVYVVFLLAPVLGFSFDAVRHVYTGVMLVLTAASVPLWMRSLRISLSPTAVWVAMVAVMSSYAAIDGLHLDQLTLLVAFLVAASMAALARGWLALAGLLLALAAIKPQLVILVAVFLLLWAVGELRSRKWFAIAFGGTMAALVAGSEVVLPGWFGLWVRATHEYVRSHRPSLLVNMLGVRTGMMVAAVGVLVCGVMFWRARKESVGSDRFNFALVSALALTQLVIPNAGGGAFYNHLLLIPAALWLFTSGKILAGRRLLTRFTWAIAVGVLAGAWVLALLVSLAALLLHPSYRSDAALSVGGPELLVYDFPLALALFVLIAAPDVGRAAAYD